VREGTGERTGPRERRDGEWRGIVKDAYRFFRDAEGEASPRLYMLC